MPIRYIKNPPVYKARLFQGDRENATLISAWLADNNLHSAWYASIEPYEVDGTVVPGRDEILVIELEDGENVVVQPNTWIVIDEDGNVKDYTDADFVRQFSVSPVPIRF
jgi:hypothetical protein